MTNEYLNHLYNYDAQASGLLGSFDASGKYSIADNLKNELLKANKLITDYREELITANALAGAYKFDFRVLIQEGEANKKRAGLFLIEKCSQGFYEKEIQTLIHYVILPNDGAFIDAIKKEFNLYTRDESEGIDMANAMLKALLTRKSEISTHQKNSIIILADLDREYVVKILALLKGYGVYGNKLLVDFKNIINTKKLEKGAVNYWKELKTVLDKLLIANAVIFDNNIMAKIEALQNNYLSTFKETKIPLIIEDVTPAKGKNKGGGKSTKISDYDGKVYKYVGLPTPKKAETIQTNSSSKGNTLISKPLEKKENKLKKRPTVPNPHINKEDKDKVYNPFEIVGKTINNENEKELTM